jgi:hypothetical protein
VTDFRQAVTGWILVAGCMMLLGIGSFIGAQLSGSHEVSRASIEQWRRYATEVEQGIKTPSASSTRILTETAIAQHEYATSAGQLLRLVGGGIGFLAFLLTIDLVRYRARHTVPRRPRGAERPSVEGH